MFGTPHVLTPLQLTLNMKHSRRAVLCIKSAFGTRQSREQKSLLNTSPMKTSPLEAGSLAMLEWLLSSLAPASLLETTVLLQHKVRNAKYVFWDLEGSLVRGWQRGRRERSGEGVSTSSALQGGMNHSYTIAKRRGNQLSKKHCGPWPEGPAAAGRGLGSPPGSSTWPSWVPFCKVPLLSMPTTKAWGQDRRALQVYGTQHAWLSPSGVLRGGCCDSRKAGWRKGNVIFLWQD